MPNISIKHLSSSMQFDLCEELGAAAIHTLSLIDLPELGGSKKIADKYGEVRTLIDY